MKQRQVLIATGSEGKRNEIQRVLESLPFEFVALSDLGTQIAEPEEGDVSIEENAILKARYYGEKSGMLTIAGDSGLFIDAFDGWPGVETARVRAQDDDTMSLLFGKMQDVPDGERGAQFRCVTAVYDPENKSIYTSYGELDGEILREPANSGENLWGYNQPFYVTEIERGLGDMTVSEKNAISHRSKSLHHLKYFLQNQFRGKHIVVPIALIIKDGKLLAAKRHDPHRPEYHGKYEFPGGAVELGEGLEDNLMREILEETGYEIEIVERLGQIKTDYREDFNYQVYLIPYVCKIIGGDGQYDDQEIIQIDWFLPDDFIPVQKVGKDDEFYKELLPELKHIIKEHNL